MIADFERAYDKVSTDNLHSNNNVDIDRLYMSINKVIGKFAYSKNNSFDEYLKNFSNNNIEIIKKKITSNSLLEIEKVIVGNKLSLPIFNNNILKQF